MADKSKDQSDHSSDSSSDNSDHIHDPDYSARWSQRLMKQKSFTSFGHDYQKMKVAGIGSSSETPSRGRKCGRPPKKRDCEQVGLQNVKIPRKARAKRKQTSWNVQRSASRRNKILKATILSWLIDSEAIQEGAEVCFMDETGESGLKEGKITREGILCGCCNEVFAVMDFEVHAGSNTRKPYEKIFIAEARVSLLSCMIEAWNRPEESKHHSLNLIETRGNATDSHDDACVICADGGNLMCCDKCNSTYHQACMGMEELPQGSWYCPYCVCKLCGEISPDPNNYLLTCSQCEKRYHWECFRDREHLDIDINSKPLSFCDHSCREVYEKLGKMVGAENEIDEGIKWTLLRRMDQEFSVYVDDLYQRTECHSKLAVAWRVMEECFETIVDRHTGINIIQSVVYNCGSNFNRINFRGFYTVILEKDNEIISVACLRIHGTKLTEMPFIATREIYRRKGMCAKLMTAIESTLCYLKVENLIIPSIEGRIGKWIHSYGFRRTEAKSMDIMYFNTLMFHDSVRLMKTLCSPLSTEANSKINEVVEMEPQNQILKSTKVLSENLEFFDLNLEPGPDR